MSDGLKDEQKTRIVNSMCMTWRHDFGLDKRDDHFGSCGMTDDERETLRAQMGQLFDHHIAPEIAKSQRLQQQVATLQSAPTSWQSAYDKGRADGTKTRLSELEQERGISARLRAERDAIAAERDQLQAEVEALQKEAELYRRLRNLPEGMLGASGVPCVAVPDGPKSGRYVSGADLDAVMGAAQ